MTDHFRSRKLSIFLAFLLGLIGSLVVFMTWNFSGFFWQGRDLRIRLDQPTVVRQIQALSRLETVVYRVEKIIEGERASRWFPSILGGDRVLMIIHAEITAGIDLGELAPDGVQTKDDSIRIKLPAPIIFSTRIDNRNSRVYSRDTGLFAPFDPHLETEVRRSAEEELERSALRDGILKTAERNAETAVGTLLQGLGFHRVEFY
jgi:hypothetical protein